jgi:phosphoadenosine phosphosulfate reductase
MRNLMSSLQIDHTALVKELAEVSARFETASPGDIVRWAIERFDGDVVYACSFQDIVLLDIAHAVDPDLEVIFLDTEAHFDETLAYRDEVAQRYDLNLTITHPAPGATPCGQDGCCAARKVAPLKEAVKGRAAWLTALKRVDASTRDKAPIVSWDEAFGLVKLNPMATWTDEDIASYEQTHELPIHPLIPQGYLSIGCAPTTRPVAPGDDPRSGRWSNSSKIECGLHEPSSS